MAIEKILEQSDNIPLFLRGTTAMKLLWLLNIDRAKYLNERVNDLYLWPITEGFETQEITPIAPIPEICTLEKCRQEAISWAFMRAGASKAGLVVYFNRDILKTGYDIDDNYKHAGILLAASQKVDENFDYQETIALIEPLVPAGFEKLKNKLPPHIPLANPIFQDNSHSKYHNPDIGYPGDRDIFMMSLVLSSSSPQPR